MTNQKNMTKQEALIAVYLLNPGQRDYKVGNASSWKKLASQLKEKNLYKIFIEIELPLIRVLKKMEAWGIKLDLRWLNGLSKQAEKRIYELTKEIYKAAGEEFNIASPIQLREVLFDKLRIPADNLKKTGKTKAVSTAATELEKIREMHPIIGLIFEYRELTKLKSTYLDALPELVAEDGRVHTKYSQTIAATGRLSSSDPNLQNIPIRTELGNQVRKAFVAEKGFVLVFFRQRRIRLRRRAKRFSFSNSRSNFWSRRI
jgi:DNA polymerase I